MTTTTTKTTRISVNSNNNDHDKKDRKDQRQSKATATIGSNIVVDGLPSPAGALGRSFARLFVRAVAGAPPVLLPRIFVDFRRFSWIMVPATTRTARVAPVALDRALNADGTTNKRGGSEQKYERRHYHEHGHRTYITGTIKSINQQSAR